ncbi:AEC family transporter [Petroclostridium sp. X23]|uniref:AEC family transporter n=1 Tax=Petroclostridium sp. X23 TaxID=3045146 RepID=UPI0024AD64DD|nr:AEC family transporter [Petroclostridium sp. X23]WHH57440.1 AEC family transporter [Petroclostridium sp. X23]
MDFIVTLNQILVIFILLLVGFLVRKLNIVDISFTKNLSSFLFNVVLPAMIINAFNYPFSMQVIRDAGWLIVICIGIILLSAGVSIIAVKLLNVDQASRNVFEFSIMFSNFAFMGYPVIEALFGKEGILYASLFSLPLYILFNSLGVIMFMRKDAKGMGNIHLRDIVNPPMVALIIGLCIFLFSIQLPKPIAQTVSMVGNTITPLAMVLSGLILANAAFSKMFSNYKVYIVSFIRLILLPVAVLLVLKLFNLELLMIGIPVIVTAMPIPANSAILAEKFDGNAYLGAQSVFISTLLSVLTIPIIALFL